jgi:hypothetical protein
MAKEYTNLFHSKDLQNLPKLVFFGLKTNHLATLIGNVTKIPGGESNPRSTGREIDHWPQKSPDHLRKHRNTSLHNMWFLYQYLLLKYIIVPNPLFLFLNTQTMQIKSTINSSITMLSLKNIFLPWRDPNPGLLFLR